jgi:hypothetical protein
MAQALARLCHWPAVDPKQAFTLARQVGSNADKLAVRPKQIKCRSRPIADLRGRCSEWQQGALSARRCTAFEREQCGTIRTFGECALRVFMTLIGPTRIRLRALWLSRDSRITNAGAPTRAAQLRAYRQSEDFYRHCAEAVLCLQIGFERTRARHEGCPICTSRQHQYC